MFSRLLATRDRISSTFKDKLVNFLIKYKTKTALQIDKLLIEEILRWPEPIYMRVGYVFESRFSVGTIN